MQNVLGPPTILGAPRPHLLSSSAGSQALLSPLPPCYFHSRAVLFSLLESWRPHTLISGPSQSGWQLPEDRSAALCWEKSYILRFVFLKQLALTQLETLARCVASGPPRASLPGCSVTHVIQVLHQNKTAPDSKKAFVQTLGNSSPLQSRQADSGSKK